jgi:hypothetical protein
VQLNLGGLLQRILYSDHFILCPIIADGCRIPPVISAFLFSCYFLLTQLVDD